MHPTTIKRIVVLLCFTLFPRLITAHDATPHKIKLGEEWFSYDDAMPILLKQLDGDAEQRFHAVEMLQYYGDTLISTRAFKRLLEIVDEKVNFALLDQKAALSTSKATGSFTAETPEEQLLLQKCAIKLQTLLAVAMSGSPDGSNRVKRLLASPSATERAIAHEVEATQASEGMWRRGKVASAQPANRVFLGSKQVEPHTFQAAVTKASESQDPAQMREVLRSLTLGGAFVLLDSPGGDVTLLQLLTATQEAAQKDGDFRQQRRQGFRDAMLYLDSLPPETLKLHRVLISAVAEDIDVEIAEMGRTLLAILPAP